MRCFLNKEKQWKWSFHVSDEHPTCDELPHKIWENQFLIGVVQGNWTINVSAGKMAIAMFWQVSMALWKNKKEWSMFNYVKQLISLQITRCEWLLVHIHGKSSPFDEQMNEFCKADTFLIELSRGACENWTSKWPLFQHTIWKCNSFISFPLVLVSQNVKSNGQVKTKNKQILIDSKSHLTFAAGTMIFVLTLVLSV